MKVVESTDELGNDLAGVMSLQRRLAGMEKDLDAIQAKVRQLHHSVAGFPYSKTRKTHYIIDCVLTLVNLFT